MLKKIESIKEESKKRSVKKDFASYSYQLEAPELQKKITQDTKTTDEESKELSRSFSSHYANTGYGTSGTGGYTGLQSTYHHHSIGFDPINIVVSVSLLSFLIQALQGLLTRSRLPTPVTEARYLDEVQNWFKKYEQNNLLKPLKVDKFLKKKYPKKYSL
ncbi:hypothetical protein JYU34_017548 [Plutella xylostella]|uniref:Uncharacterized protein n=1 Tax=Plutella xylostella TaxID=51655 RepID=A0ABQ7Q1M0_PLUXY|nr:hypothetical protein JYU34_017548 [Plutella xylostella]